MTWLLKTADVDAETLRATAAGLPSVHEATVVANRTVDLDADSTATVALSFTPEEAGEYDLAVGGASAGTVSVSATDARTEPTTTRRPTTGTATERTRTTTANGTATTTGADSPGFGILLFLLAVVVAIGLLSRRRS